MSSFQSSQYINFEAEEKAQRKQYKHVKQEWRDARDLQESVEIELRTFEDSLERKQYTWQEDDEIELRAFEDSLERLTEMEAKLLAIKNVSNNIKKSGKSSTGYIWRLINDTPKRVTLIQYPQKVVNNISYLNTLVDVYTTHLTDVFRRMIVNKRAVKESIENDDIYLVETDDIRRVMFDLTFTHLDHHVEFENDLAMDGLTEYNTIINYTTKAGHHAGCSFQEILSDKLQKAFSQVSTYVQNRHNFDCMIYSMVYCELIAINNHLMIQAVYDESDN